LKITNLTWKEFADINREMVVILPVGSIEQHGLHLPIGNDTIVASKFAEKVAERINALVLPEISYGFIYTFSKFPGSFGISARTLIHLIQEVCSEIIKEGFRKIVLLNAHDENHEALVLAAKYLSDQYEISPLIIEWSQIARTELRQIKESDYEMHGGEALTSLLLHWCPELVKTNEIVDEFPTFLKVTEDNLYRQENKAYLIQQISPKQITSGTCGFPSRATLKKGQVIEEAVVRNICKLIIDLGWKN
jgi:creatinine amidohydrolase